MASTKVRVTAKRQKRSVYLCIEQDGEIVFRSTDEAPALVYWLARKQRPVTLVKLKVLRGIPVESLVGSVLAVPATG